MKEKREKRKIGVISELFQGKDDQIQSARVKTPCHYLDRPINGCIFWYKTKTKQYGSDKKKLNVEAKEFRPKRPAVAIPSAKIKGIAELDD